MLRCVIRKAEWCNGKRVSLIGRRTWEQVLIPTASVTVDQSTSQWPQILLILIEGISTQRLPTSLKSEAWIKTKLKTVLLNITKIFKIFNWQLFFIEKRAVKFCMVLTCQEQFCWWSGQLVIYNTILYLCVVLHFKWCFYIYYHIRSSQ